MSKSLCFRKFGEAVRTRGKLPQKSRERDVVCRTGNSKVRSHKNKVTYELHGCPIVKADKHRKIAQLNNCGYSTPTTKSHMNGALSEISNKKVSQKKGKWYVNDEKYENGGVVRF